MLTVSLHGIKIHAPYGFYPQEHKLGNDFETDVDIWLPDQQPWPFADYVLIHQTVAEVFSRQADFLEDFVWQIHSALKLQFPDSEKIRVATRKLHPPMPGEVAWSQVCYEL